MPKVFMVQPDGKVPLRARRAVDFYRYLQATGRSMPGVVHLARQKSVRFEETMVFVLLLMAAVAVCLPLYCLTGTLLAFSIAPMIVMVADRVTLRITASCATGPHSLIEWVASRALGTLCKPGRYHLEGVAKGWIVPADA